MKKKITALLLALLLVGSLASCSGSENTAEDNSAVVDVATEESVTDASETEGENTTTAVDQDTVEFNKDTALAYFETSEGQEWLYQYLFGAEEADNASADETNDGSADDTGDAIADDTDNGSADDTDDGSANEADNASVDETNGASTTAFDALDAEEKAKKISDYLAGDDIDLMTLMEVQIEDNKLQDYGEEFAGKGNAKIVEMLLENEEFHTEDWVTLYESLNEEQQEGFLEWYEENNPGSDTDTGDTNEENTDTDDDAEAATGYDAWLSAKLQEEENADDRSTVWNDLTSPELLQEYLATEGGQAFLRSDEVQQLLADYYTDNEDAMKELAVNTGYRGKMVKSFAIVLAIVVVVLLAVFAGVLLLLLSRANKQEAKLRQKLKEAREQLEAVPTRPAGGMDLTLKEKLTASPVRQTPVAPVAPVTPPPPPVVQETPKPTVQEKPVTPPAPPAAPTITGYYSLAEEAVEAARYHLAPKFSVQKVSERPVNPPTPYVGYSDHTLDLNRDYYAKAGGNKANNARAWDYLMGTTVQITECFSIVSQNGMPITDVSSATGKQIVSVERAKMGADGSIIARGTITLS